LTYLHKREPTVQESAFQRLNRSRVGVDMKRRVFLVLAVTIGTLVAGVTNASAGSYCSLDPTVGAGVPLLKYSLGVKVAGSTVYASGTSSSTTFGGGVYIP
jgi:hypothetical protein